MPHPLQDDEDRDVVESFEELMDEYERDYAAHFGFDYKNEGPHINKHDIYQYVCDYCGGDIATPLSKCPECGAGGLG